VADEHRRADTDQPIECGGCIDGPDLEISNRPRCGGLSRAIEGRHLSAGLDRAASRGRGSIPSQRDLTTRHCLSTGWTVVGEYVEPGASATDDRRPVFQAMLERACDADHPYFLLAILPRWSHDGNDDPQASPSRRRGRLDDATDWLRSVAGNDAPDHRNLR
jgi:hypothetical protein